jgi:hypothetical protein
MACVLLLVNYRPEYQHVWGSKRYYRQLRLDAFDGERRRVARLAPGLRSHVDVAQAPSSSAPRATRFPGKRPHIGRDHCARRPRGDYRLTRALETLQIPATAQANLASRIDRLDPADKRLLQAAAVIGKDVLPRCSKPSGTSTVMRSAEAPSACEARVPLRIWLLPDVEYTFRTRSRMRPRTRACSARGGGLHGRIVECRAAVLGSAD